VNWATMSVVLYKFYSDMDAKGNGCRKAAVRSLNHLKREGTPMIYLYKTQYKSQHPVP
jgi:hypothetical protein